ncbi:hypothetical protein KU392_07265 [Advenella alkanexedens]|uniref:Uncharacterized protein n=1 Tax=Advenella alkanexedens TaxID=1481665 RepID=A0ABS6NNB3_9BURK|nr:hypothetical protein [Advenella alkanexedens]MBV4397050.1 hypothetical protein [Advenella alkanexedens]
MGRRSRHSHAGAWERVKLELQALRDTINDLDPDSMSPREALDALYKLRNLFGQKE